MLVLLVFVGVVLLAALLLFIPSVRRWVGEDIEEMAPQRSQPISGGISPADEDRGS